MEKKASVKKTKKAVTKPAKKAPKKAAAKKTTKKLDVKKTSKKTPKKVSKPRAKKTVAVKPVIDSTGVVTLKSVDDAGDSSQSEGGRVEPAVDKDTGVVTMVPVKD